MITVQLNRADFEYDIHSLVKAFFPSEDVSVGVGERETEGEISFHIVTNYFTDSIEIMFFVPGEKQKPEQKRVMEVDFSDRKETKNRLKQAYYQMLCEYAKKSLPWGTLTGIRPTKIPMAFERGQEERFYSELHEGNLFCIG